jgi:hypothetical protein
MRISMTNQSDLLQMLEPIAWELRKLEDQLNRGLQPRRDLEDAIAAIRAGGAGEQPKPSHGDSTARAGDIGASDTARLDWLQRQDLNELCFALVQDAPRDGDYVINAGNGPFYGATLREAIDAAMKGAKS